MQLFFNNAIIWHFALITKKNLLIGKFNKVAKNRILPAKIALFNPPIPYLSQLR